MTTIDKEEAKQTIKDEISACKKWCKENKAVLLYTGIVFGTGFIFGSKSCRPTIKRLNKMIADLSKRPPIVYAGDPGDGVQSLVLFDSNIPKACFVLRDDYTNEELFTFFNELKNITSIMRHF